MIPIVMALDENYALPTCVTIHSILMNASCDTEYKFYLMVTDTLSDASKQKIKMVLEPYPRVQIEYLDMETLFDDAYIPNSSHVSRATYFRFMIPEMLATYDKCIYLDVDIVVCDDLTELYEINLADNYLAGVKSISPVVVDENMEYHKKLEIPSLDQFFNAGVLLMNLSAMRHADLTNELLHETNKENRDDEIFASQGILNKVCYNRILLLPLKFNVPIHKIKRPHTQELINQLFSPDEIEEAANNPIIVHYIGNSKPWNRLFDTFSYHWYKFALSSPFSEEIYRDATKIEQEKGKKAADKFEQSLQKNESLRQRNTQLEQKNESLRQRSTQLEQKNE
ncbi:MAG: hypothetical protein FWG65_02500, partial [Turicibacter sp.]|nr:hypothetical protein [Turicibacter sp.]